MCTVRGMLAAPTGRVYNGPMESQPNVLVFFTDQQRWDCSGLHGNPLDLMPNYDRFARQGTHFPVAVTPQPVCGPARSCIQTSRYASETGVWHNGPTLDPTLPNMAGAFAEAGYRTGYIGKWHLYEHPKEEPGRVPEDARAGYEDWLVSNILEFTSDELHTTLYDNDGNEVSLPGYRVDALADATIRYINDHSGDGRPLFLYTSFIEPHHQNSVDDYPPPTGYRERYTGKWMPPDLAALGGSAHQHIGGYYGMVKRLDEAFGRVLDAIESLGLRENTIVLFTSDHGNHFKTRNGEYKRSCHEASVRIPFALDGPGFAGGGHRSEMISLIDIMPTLLDACGVPAPDGMRGRSIMPRLRGEGGSWPDDVFIQISEAETGRAIRTGRWKYAVTDPTVDEHGRRSFAPHGQRYVETHLYDLKHDPYELRNLVGIGAYRPVADQMRERLLRRMAEANEPEVEIESAPVVRSGQLQIKPGEELL